MGFWDAAAEFIMGGSGERRPAIKAKCPKCKTDIDTAMERCPGCGTHIELLLRIKCPKCGVPNSLRDKKCKKCGEALWEAAPDQGPKKTYYTCPICNYKADYYMLKCPACGTRFA